MHNFKKLFFLTHISWLVAAPALHETDIPAVVPMLYEAAQDGKLEAVKQLVQWERAYHGAKAVELLSKALDYAIAKQDVHATELLTRQLADEKMGFSERYVGRLTVMLSMIFGLTLLFGVRTG